MPSQTDTKKVYAITKTTARSQAAAEISHYKELVQNLNFLIFWVDEGSYNHIRADDSIWPKETSAMEKLSAPKSGRIFRSRDMHKFVVISHGPVEDVADKELAFEKFLKKKKQEKRPLQLEEISKLDITGLTAKIKKRRLEDRTLVNVSTDENVSPLHNSLTLAPTSKYPTLRDAESEQHNIFEDSTDFLPTEALRYVALGTPRGLQQGNGDLEDEELEEEYVNGNSELYENPAQTTVDSPQVSASDPQLNRTLSRLTSVVEELSTEIKGLKTVNCKLVTELRYLRESVFCPSRPEKVKENACITFGPSDFNLMCLHGETPAKFGIALARHLFTTDELINGMMEPATSTGRVALQQDRVEKLKGCKLLYYIAEIKFSNH